MCLIAEPTIYYHCFYCKKGFSTEKEKLKEHWESGGCKRLRECYTTRLIVQPRAGYFCKAFLNPKNVDMDLYELVIKKISWPNINFHFTTGNNWKSARQETWLDTESDVEK